MNSEQTMNAMRTVSFAPSYTLRDRLPVNEAAQLAAQLPELVRGVYYEDWKPAVVPLTYRNAAGFLDRVADEAVLHGETEASFATTATARVLRQHVSDGELSDVFDLLTWGGSSANRADRPATRGHVVLVLEGGIRT